MNTVDWIIIAATVVFAVSGWRQGFVRGLFSMIGFLGGGLIAAAYVPELLGRFALPEMGRLVVTLCIVLAAASVGQFLASLVAARLHARLTWQPVRAVDNAGGALFSVVAFAAVLWVLASAVALLPDRGIAHEVRASALLGRLDAAVPSAARDWMSGMREFVDSTGFPRVFQGLTESPGAPVQAPDTALPATPAIRAATASVVRVQGAAPDCSSTITGSGFVYAPGRVMTNAHVVAGTEDLSVQVRAKGPFVSARVVYFDPDTDVAVLAVPGLQAPALVFDDDGERGVDAVVAGFPGGGALDLEPARIRSEVSARGHDIYDGGDVVREVFSLRANVRQGNSGGPLLDAQGDVLGVVFAASIEDPNTGYALTASQVADAARLGAAASAAVANGTCAN